VSADTAEISLAAVRARIPDRAGARAHTRAAVPVLGAGVPVALTPAGSPIGTLRLLLYPVDAASAAEVLAGRAPSGMEAAPGYPSPFSLDLMSLASQGASPGDVGPFFIVRRADRALVGEIGCRIDGATGTAHVGYTIAEHCWNLGYASEALRALLRHLLDDVGVPRVEAETTAGHLASRRVMEKAGMRLRGRRKAEGGRVSYEAVRGAWRYDLPVSVGRRAARGGRQRHRRRGGLRLIT
jgi:RimJ/RimL family protein N-acetyltransferase